jgi:hypothetical protein
MEQQPEDRHTPGGVQPDVRVHVSTQPHPSALERTRRAYEAWSAQQDSGLWSEIDEAPTIAQRA